jgi:anaerobic selenocysteine-containing dehydrogenase
MPSSTATGTDHYAPSPDLVTIAREFTNHGKRAVADIHRGVSQHTNGFYNVFAWYTLNALIGNFDWAGWCGPRLTA